MQLHNIKHIHLDFQLPPPIYGNELTTISDRAERTIKLVKGIKAIEGGVIITALTGEEYIVPLNRVKWMREE